MRAALHAPILPRVMEEGESKKAALILMKNSHFDGTPQEVSIDFSITFLSACNIIYRQTKVEYMAFYSNNIPVSRTLGVKIDFLV